jgi:uncharacterized surface protein with fasciclin (FAS1) repeats
LISRGDGEIILAHLFDSRSADALNAVRTGFPDILRKTDYQRISNRYRKCFIFYYQIEYQEEISLKITRFFLVLAIMVTVLVLSAGCTTEQSDKVTPVPTSTATVTAGASPDQAAMKNIMETLETDGRFTTLVAALKATELNDTLSSPESTFTVFAPSDDAFKKLSSGGIDTLLKDPQGDILQILLYHIVRGKIMSADLAKLNSTETLQGASLSIGTSGGMITVDDANVIVTDIECSNGVIHIVDTVMLPPV